MKIILSIIAAVGLMAVSVQAQSPTYAPQVALSSYIVSGSTQSNAISALIDVRKQQNVAIQWVSVGNATNTNTLSFSASVDGLTWDTNRYNVSVRDKATSVMLTNITVAGIGYLRIENLTNLVSSPTTNTVTYGVKISSP